MMQQHIVDRLAILENLTFTPVRLPCPGQYAKGHFYLCVAQTGIDAGRDGRIFVACTNDGWVVKAGWEARE